MLTALLVVCAAGFSHGDVFYLKNAALKVQNRFSDPDCWGVGFSGNENPDRRIPGEEDWIYYADSYQSYFDFDMEGADRTVKGFSFTGFREDYGYRYLTLTNGTLAFSSNFTNTRAIVTCWDLGRFVVDDDCYGRLGNFGAATKLTVESGGEIYLGGHLSLNFVSAMNKDGGRFTLNPNGSLVLPTNMGGDGAFTNYGMFDIPHGLRLDCAGTVIGARAIDFNQITGTMTLGGPLVKGFSETNPSVRFTLSGGTLAATGDAGFTGFDAVSMTANALATVVIASGKTLDLSNMAFGDGTSLTKTGAGTLRLKAAAPTNFALSEGILLVGGTAFGSLSVGSGVSIVPDASLGAGDIVFAGKDASEVAAAVACLEPAPEGLRYLVANGVVSLASAATGDTDFSADGEASLSEPSRWPAGRVPVGETVTVRGDHTVAVLDAKTPAFQSITVSEGATLKVVGAVEAMPAIALSADARILFAEGSSVVLPTDFSALANSLQVPVFEVAAGAVVNIGSARKFKNVHIKLYGEIDWDENVWFGFAESGETTYAGFDVDGGTLRCLAPGVEKSINWIQPEKGGRVSVPGGTLTLRSLKTLPGFPDLGTSYYGESFGYQNPVDEKIEIVLDNTVINQYGATMYVAGGVTVRAVNGGGIRKPGELDSWGFYNRIVLRDEGRLVLESDSLFQYHYSRFNVEFCPSSDGFEQVVVRDGSWMAVQYPSGNGKATARFEDGWWDVLRLQTLDPVYHPEITDARMWTTNVFHGFKGVTVPEGRFVGIRSSARWTQGVPWDPVAVLDPAAPLSGGGSLVVSNATPGQAFAVIVTCADNSATGEAKVLPSSDPATLYFEDGAKWAGTVVADGRVALTNCTASGAATVSFGTLELKGRFPIRLWKGDSGVSCDVVNLSAIVNAGGTIRPIPQAGYRPHAGDTFEVGSISENAKNLPAMAKGWTIHMGEAVSGRRPLLLEYTPPGLAVIIK